MTRGDLLMVSDEVQKAARFCREELMLGFDCAESRGRRHLDNDSFLITDPYLSDSHDIVQSKAFRRLGDKTQVFYRPDNGHVRNRSIHTMEVTYLAKVIASELGLNINLVEAIALGHDLGHTPLGHDGEIFISLISGKNFKHAKMSVIVAQDVEHNGRGLNLSYEVLQGILYHSGLTLPQGVRLSQEARLVKLCDKFCFIFSDYSDLQRYGIRDSKIDELVNIFGSNHRQRVKTIIEALISETAASGEVSFERNVVARCFSELKEQMYKRVYLKHNHAESLGDLMPRTFSFLCAELEKPVAILALALMTDSDLRHLAAGGCHITNDPFYGTSIYDILSFIKSADIDITNADLSWA